VVSYLQHNSSGAQKLPGIVCMHANSITVNNKTAISANTLKIALKFSYAQFPCATLTGETNVSFLGCHVKAKEIWLQSKSSHCKVPTHLSTCFEKKCDGANVWNIVSGQHYENYSFKQDNISCNTVISWQKQWAKINLL